MSDVNLTADEQPGSSTAVITNDVQGADGAAVTAGTLSGDPWQPVLNATALHLAPSARNDCD